MQLEKFRSNLNSNETETVETLNRHLQTLDGSVSQAFTKDHSYSFSWTSLTNELKEYGYTFSQKSKSFVKSETNEDARTGGSVKKNKQLETIIGNLKKKADTKTKQITVRLEESTLNEINSILKNNAEYTRTDFISDILKWGLEEIKKNGGIYNE